MTKVMGFPGRVSAALVALPMAVTLTMPAFAAAASVAEDALCRAFDDGTACEALDHGLTEPGGGLRWRRLAGASDWRGAAERCAALGDGWRLPRLGELDAAYERTAFGYCSLTAWSSTSDDPGLTAWERGVTYEGSPKCTTAPDGTYGCIGGCGPIAMVRQPAPSTRALAVVCVNDQGG